MSDFKLPSSAQRASLVERQRRYQAHDRATLLAYLASRGLDEATTDRYGLGIVPSSEDRAEIAGRLAIPYLTPAGPLGMKFRCIDPVHGDHKGDEAGKCPKYIGDPGFHPPLYNAGSLLEDSDIAFICEGEIDALTVHALTGYPAVGVPGVSQWKHADNGFWPRCFSAFDRVIVPADGDKAGQDLAKTIARDIQETSVVYLPAGTDCNSFIRDHGPAEFLRKCDLPVAPAEV
jgi:DNA primase